jgi:hypothetical protein
LPEKVDEALSAYLRRTGARQSTVIGTAVSEWLRLVNHPRIRFVEPVRGERRAALVDGPEVWSVAESWQQHAPEERTVAGVAGTLGLRPDQVGAALAYWADNREEIDTLIDRIHLAQDEEYAAWQRRQALQAMA